jgi:hypothetical protein
LPGDGLSTMCKMGEAPYTCTPGSFLAWLSVTTPAFEAKESERSLRPGGAESNTHTSVTT